MRSVASTGTVEVPKKREPSLTLSFRSTRHLLEWVDDLSPQQAGTLSIGNEEHGVLVAIFVEQNRVCWAAASGLASRLLDLLRKGASEKSDEVRRVVLQARTERRPLWARLLASHALSFEALHEAMRQHTIESLCVLSGVSLRALWSPRQASFCYPFAFRTIDLLVAVSAAELPDLAALAQAQLTSMVMEGETAIALARHEAGTRIVAFCGELDSGVGKAMDLAAWVTGMSDLGDALAGHSRAVLLRGRGGRNLVVLRRGDLLILVHTDDRGVARFLQQRQHISSSHADLMSGCPL